MEIYPRGIYDAIMFYHRKYGKPIIIAENGIATEDLERHYWTKHAKETE